MRWAHVGDVDAGERLIYWVLIYVLQPYFNDPIDHWLKKILISDGGLGGDPGWEMEHIPESPGPGSYRVWADPEMSGIEPSEVIYSDEVVRRAVRESLLALGVAHPEKALEAQEVIKRYNLDRLRPGRHR